MSIIKLLEEVLDFLEEEVVVPTDEKYPYAYRCGVYSANAKIAKVKVSWILREIKGGE